MALTIKGTPKGSTSTTVAIPTHAVGDLIVIYTNAGTIPAAGGTVPTWTTIVSNSGVKVVYAVATATNHTSGAWASSSTLIAVVLSGQNTTTPVGGSAADANLAGSGTSPNTAPSITLSATDGSSKILHFISGFHIGSSSTWGAAPAGYTSLLSLNPPPSSSGYRLLSKDTTTSDGSVGQTYTDLQGYQFRASVEILAPAVSNTGGFFAMF